MVEMTMIPEVLLCPISLDLLSDPVTLHTTAQTYDRPNILRWLAAGHRTCPVTMRALPPLRQPDRLLVPNRTLKHLIDRCWLLTGTCNSNSLAELALPVLRDNLQLLVSPTTVVETLRIVRSLSPPGFCPLLLRLLLLLGPRGPNDDDDQHAAVELAVDCLLASPSTDELATALHGALQGENLALLLRHGSPMVKTGLCRLIDIAAAAMAVGEQQQLSCAEPVMAALVDLVHDSGNNADTAVRAMSSLCSWDQESRETAVAVGVVDALISYISRHRKMSEGRVCLGLALEMLELVLISVEAGRQAMYTHPSATASLVMMVFRVPSSLDVGEHAVGSLLVACRESAMVRVDAINAGLLTQLLLLLQSRCSPKAKANARALLKLLRATWARH